MFLEIGHDPIADFLGDIEGGLDQLAFVRDLTFLYGSRRYVRSGHDADAYPQVGEGGVDAAQEVQLVLYGLAGLPGSPKVRAIV